MADQARTAEQRVQAAFSAPIPRVYFNSFVTTLTSGDVCVILELNGSPIAIANMSLTIAKSLGVALSGTISGVEVHTDHEIMTSTELEKALVPASAGKGKK